MLILISSCLFVASRDFLLAHPFTGSTATSRAGSSGIGVDGMHPSGAATPVYRGIAPSSTPTTDRIKAYKPNS